VDLNHGPLPRQGDGSSRFKLDLPRRRGHVRALLGPLPRTRLLRNLTADVSCQGPLLPPAYRQPVPTLTTTV
jgi:hypothetical protein